MSLSRILTALFPGNLETLGLVCDEYANTFVASMGYYYQGSTPSTTTLSPTPPGPTATVDYYVPFSVTTVTTTYSGSTTLLTTVSPISGGTETAYDYVPSSSVLPMTSSTPYSSLSGAIYTTLTSGNSQFISTVTTAGYTYVAYVSPEPTTTVTSTLGAGASPYTLTVQASGYSQVSL